MGLTRQARFRSILKLIWTGNAPKSLYEKYLSMVLLIYFIGVLIAALVYPGGFSFLYVYISYLGGPAQNPAGYLVYNVSVFLTGVLIIPHFLYMHRRLYPTMKIATFLCTSTGVLGSAAFATLGIFYQGILWHQLVSNISFGGFFASLFFALLVLLRKIMLQNQWPTRWHLALLYGLVLGITGTSIFFTSEGDFLQNFPIDPIFLEHKIWEWCFFFAVLIGLIGLYALTPRNAHAKK